MASIGNVTVNVEASDPYGPCPCGSGRKFKFCCRLVDVRIRCTQLAPYYWEGTVVNSAMSTRGQSATDCVEELAGRLGLSGREFALVVDQSTSDIRVFSRRPTEPCASCKGSGTYVGLNEVADCSTCSGAGRVAL